MADDDEDKPVLHHAKIDDEFLKHPYSGADIRNPLREKGASQPIIFCAGEYEHNCLEEALHDWNVVSVSEAGFRDMVNTWCTQRGIDGAGTKTTALSKSGHRAALGKLRDMSNSFEFTVNLRKSSYIAPRNERRRPGGNKEAGYRGSHVDKVNIEVSDQDGKGLRVESITEGLMTQWNRAHPSFAVRVGDMLVKVNATRGSGAQMLDEMAAAHDQLRIIVRRVQSDYRRTSRDSQRRPSEASNANGALGVGASGDDDGLALKGLANPKAASRKKPPADTS